MPSHVTSGANVAGELDPSSAGGATNQPLLQCEGVTKSFSGVRALRGVDFELRPGEVHALLGQNGAGKSTLIKLVAGVTQKDEGRIRIRGEDVDDRSGVDDALAAGVAVVYQEFSLVPTLSVGANLFLGREPRNRIGVLQKRQLMRDARAVLSEYGLKVDARIPVERLTEAYRQMTEIAKALSRNVSVLVLDEPTSSLSAEEEEILFDAINEVKKRGVGVVYITHRLAEVFRISDRVTVIRDGVNVGTFETAQTNMAFLVDAIIGREHEELRNAETDVLSEGSSEAMLGADRAGDVTATLDGDPVLELRDVSNERLRGVDLKVAPGEIVGLAGMVGSGRSEILETIFGLRPVKSGELIVHGKSKRLRGAWDAIAAGIALAPEDRHRQGLVLEHSIERNIGLPRLPELRRWGMFRRAASKARAQEAIRELGVKAPGAQTIVRNLSGGNQQKVVFGKWRDPAPKLLLLDEPTVGVDVGAREEIYGVVRRVASEGSGVLVATSELAELLLICDRIDVVANGRIVKSVARQDLENEGHLHQMVQEAQGGVSRG
jgi:ribose transport system ATP-binding protein